MKKPLKFAKFAHYVLLCLCFVDLGSLTESDIMVLPMDVLDFDAHKTLTEKVLQQFGCVRIYCGSNVAYKAEQSVNDENWFGSLKSFRSNSSDHLEIN